MAEQLITLPEAVMLQFSAAPDEWRLAAVSRLQSASFWERADSSARSSSLPPTRDVLVRNLDKRVRLRALTMSECFGLLATVSVACGLNQEYAGILAASEADGCIDDADCHHVVAPEDAV